MRIKNSNNILVHNVTFHTASSNICYLPKNTDALQITQSSNIVFKDSYLTVGDDCTAINGGNVVHCDEHPFSIYTLC